MVALSAKCQPLNWPRSHHCSPSMEFSGYWLTVMIYRIGFLYISRQLVTFSRADWIFVCVLSYFSRIWLFATLWTIDCQAPLSVDFSRQEYWNGLPYLPPGVLPDQGIKPTSSTSPVLQAVSWMLSHWESPACIYRTSIGYNVPHIFKNKTKYFFPNSEFFFILLISSLSTSSHYSSCISCTCIWAAEWGGRETSHAGYLGFKFTVIIFVGFSCHSITSDACLISLRSTLLDACWIHFLFSFNLQQLFLSVDDLACLFV